MCCWLDCRWLFSSMLLFVVVSFVICRTWNVDFSNLSIHERSRAHYLTGIGSATKRWRLTSGDGDCFRLQKVLQFHVWLQLCSWPVTVVSNLFVQKVRLRTLTMMQHSPKLNHHSMKISLLLLLILLHFLVRIGHKRLTVGVWYF